MKNSKTVKKIKKAVAVAEPKKAVSVKANDKKEVISERYANFTAKALKSNNSKRSKLFNTLKTLALSKKIGKEPKEFSIKGLIGAEYVADSLPRKIVVDLAIDKINLSIEKLPFKAKKITSLKVALGVN